MIILGKEYKKRGIDKPFGEPQPEPLSEEAEDGPSELVKFEDMKLEEKVKILKDLCDFHLENSQHFMDLMKGYDAGAHWRIEPVGKDSKGFLYWLFDDGRLFREQQSNAKSRDTHEDNWELVCYNHEGWEHFLHETLTNKPADRKLKAELTENWPTIDQELKEQEKIAKKKVKELAAIRATYDLVPRKRSSRIQAKEAMKKLHDQEVEEEKTSRRIRGLPEEKLDNVNQAEVQKMSREERAEQRRLRLEREANEKILKQLEAEQKAKEDSEVEVHLEANQVKAEESPLKIVIKRSSITDAAMQSPPSKPKKPSTQPGVTGQKPDKKVLSMVEMAIKRELEARQKSNLASRPPQQAVQTEAYQFRPPYYQHQQIQPHDMYQQQPHPYQPMAYPGPQPVFLHHPQYGYVNPQMYQQMPLRPPYDSPPMFNPHVPMQQQQAFPAQLPPHVLEHMRRQQLHYQQQQQSARNSGSAEESASPVIIDKTPPTNGAQQ